MEKIKVCHIVGSMNKGGVESVVLSYSKELKDDVSPTFVCFEDSKYIPFEEIGAIGGKVEIIPHVKHLGAFNKALTKVLNNGQFDIVHSHINTLSVFPLKVAKKCGYKIRIAHSHSQSSKKEFVRNMIKNFLKKFSKKYATYFIACGEVAGRYQFGNQAFEKGEVKIIKNAIKLSNYKFSSSDREEVRKELGIPFDANVAGNIGRLCETKNQMFILEIAKKLPDVHFVIVGGGPLEEELKNKIVEYKLSNVHLAGVTNNTARYYSAFDSFILPSLYEGVPVTGIEAQANGLYVIYSNNVPKESLLSDYGEFISIEPNYINKWVNAISNKKEHQNHNKDITTAGFNIEEASKELLNVYKSLLQK